MKRANDIGCLSDSLPNKLSLSRARALSLSRARSLSCSPATMHVMRMTEELMVRSELLQARKQDCIKEMTGVAHISGRAHRTERSHGTNHNREALHVDKMSLLKYELLPQEQNQSRETITETQAKAAKVTMREKVLRQRLELACEELTQIVADGSHGNDDLIPLGYGEPGNLQRLRQTHLQRLASLSAELANVNLLLSIAHASADDSASAAAAVSVCARGNTTVMD